MVELKVKHNNELKDFFYQLGYLMKRFYTHDKAMVDGFMLNLRWKASISALQKRVLVLFERNARYFQLNDNPFREAMAVVLEMNKDIVFQNKEDFFELKNDFMLGFLS
jgi:hypothetical protein